MTSDIISLREIQFGYSWGFCGCTQQSFYGKHPEHKHNKSSNTMPGVHKKYAQHHKHIINM